jgi:penicillin G amidase
VGWTLTGHMPRRHGFDGSVSVPWQDGVGWEGFLSPMELPRQLDPASGLVINANQRLAPRGSSTALAHDFAHGYRAYRIRELLSAPGVRDEAGSLALQLDTRGEVYEPYRALALEALAQARPPREPLERALRAWDGRAEPGSVGLGLLSCFRVLLAEALFADWLRTAREAEPGLALELPDIDTPLERVLNGSTRAQISAPGGGGWPAFLLGVLERAAQEWQSDHPALALDTARWGDQSRVQVRHPLGTQPELAALLNMPEEPLPGCGFCVRMASGTLGASERLVVSPSHEHDGILHMPAGQSGDPESPHYRDQQAAWLHGQRLALLPGPVRQAATWSP